MAGKETGKSYDNLMAFVTDERVTSIPIDRKDYVPPKSNNPNIRWEERFEITGKYLGTDKTLEEIGEKYEELSRERIRQIVKDGVGRLHRAQIPQVQAEYPLDSFDYRKPLSVESKQRISEGHGGKSIKIQRAFEEGQTLAQLKEDFTSRQIIDTRKTLRNWGTEVPYQNNPILPRFEKLKDPELPDEEKQKLLDKINNDKIIRLLSSRACLYCRFICSWA